MHGAVEDQIRGKPCRCHPQSEGCNIAQKGQIKLAVLGTPCPPFSKQRPKRFQDGTVKSHSHYSVTFSSAVDFLARFEPMVGLMEQVDGFDLPFSTTDSETPKMRLVCFVLLICMHS